MTMTKTLLATLLATLGATAAQAATLTLVAGSVNGSLADGFDIGAGPGATLDMAAMLNGSISVTAVPEPETCALMLAGLAAIGLLHGRSRRAG